MMTCPLGEVVTMDPASTFVDMDFTAVGDDGSWTMCTVRDVESRSQTGAIFKCILPSHRLFNPYTVSRGQYNIQRIY
jgi:hypothetical protein